MQEASSRREVAELQQLLRSTEALLADSQRNLLQREIELDVLRSGSTAALQVRRYCKISFSTECQLIQLSCSEDGTKGTSSITQEGLFAVDDAIISWIILNAL